MQLEKIIKKEEMNERYVTISYIDIHNRVLTKKIDILSEKKNYPNSDWNEIKEKTLFKFAETTKEFKEFFHSDIEEININDMTDDFLMTNVNNIFYFNNKIYLLKAL